MARVFDVIEYPNEMRDELVHRFPESGSGDFRIGSQVIVREGQAAVFFRDGKALDAFGPGRHTITTANIPLVTGLLGKLFNDRTPFTAEVYFVSMREFPQFKWGTPQPVPIMHPGVGLGASLLKAFGTFGLQISNPQQFVAQFVGAQGTYDFADIRDRLVGLIIQALRDLLGELKKSAFEVQGLTQEIAAGVRAKASDDFAALGLTLKAIVIQSISPSESTLSSGTGQRILFLRRSWSLASLRGGKSQGAGRRMNLASCSLQLATCNLRPAFCLLPPASCSSRLWAFLSCCHCRKAFSIVRRSKRVTSCSACLRWRWRWRAASRRCGNGARSRAAWQARRFWR